MLSLENIQYSRNNKKIINEFSLMINPGTIFEIKGANGSGKTTLLKLMSGLLEADSGKVSWNDLAIANIDANYKSAFIYIGHKFGIKKQLTVRENLEFMFLLANTKPNLDIAQACKVLELTNLYDQVCANLSAGQLQRLALARLLINQYQLWLLDEPFANLDTAGVNILIELAKKQLTQGSIVITTHQEINWQDLKVQEINLNDN